MQKIKTQAGTTHQKQKQKQLQKKIEKPKLNKNEKEIESNE